MSPSPRSREQANLQRCRPARLIAALEDEPTAEERDEDTESRSAPGPRELAQAGDRKLSLARAITAVGLGGHAGIGTFVACEWLGRLTVGTALLTRWEVAWPLIGTASVVITLAGLRWLPAKMAAGWPLGICCALAVFGFVAFVTPFALHVALGTPFVHCEREGLSIERCVGRDWSLMQDRAAYRITEGSIDVDTCTAFVEAVPAAARSPLVDGWVRCPYDDASVWERTSCEEAALPDYDQCFICSGLSVTSDHYWTIQAFDAECATTVIHYGVNVSTEAIEPCSQSIHSRGCSPW